MPPRQTRSATTRVVNDANARNAVNNATNSPDSTTSSNETLVDKPAPTSRKRAAPTEVAPKTTPEPSTTKAPSNATQPKAAQKKMYPSQCRPRSHTRKHPAGHVKRPPNAFMLFRSWFLKSDEMPQITQMSEASQILGAVWHNLPDEEQRKWHMMATEKMREHNALYPQ